MEREYKTTPIVRQYVHKYAISEKGKITSRKSSLKYNHSEKGKEHTRLYNKSQSRKDSKRKYYLKKKSENAE